MSDRASLNLTALTLLALLTLFFMSIHELAQPAVSNCEADPGLCGKVRCSTYDQRLCSLRKFPYCHALPLPFYRSLDEDYFDVWPEFGCARDLVPDDYPEGMCGSPGAEFMCAPSPLAPLR